MNDTRRVPTEWFMDDMYLKEGSGANPEVVLKMRAVWKAPRYGRRYAMRPYNGALKIFDKKHNRFVPYKEITAIDPDERLEGWQD